MYNGRMTVWLSLCLTALAYTLLSTGYILQKRGIAWIGHKGEKDRRYYRALAVWIVGFLLMNLYVVPNAAALKRLDPHIVSAMAGWGVIILVLLSQAFLKERILGSDVALTLLIVAAIVVLNVFERPEAGQDMVRLGPLIAAMALPFLLALPALIPNRSRRTRGLLFACVSGLSAGLIIVLLKILVASHGYRIASYFGSPHLYFYLVFSLGSFLALQASYKMGRMLFVGPVQYSAAILYPVLCSAAVFGNHLHAIQLAAVGAVVGGVWGMLRNHG
jgi:multidrug transporter EmrE-like cation transporter